MRAIFPASFDPITNGHLDVATRASRLFDELVLAVYDKPAKNLLFTLDERVELARASTAHLPNVARRAVQRLDGGVRAAHRRGSGRARAALGVRFRRRVPAGHGELPAGARARDCATDEP